MAHPDLTAPPSIPELSGDAAAARDYRGGHLQIIASAGAGKTEVVSQRVATLLRDEFAPESIVAFTFTERAAAGLKSRIERCVVGELALGPAFLDRLGPMFVGTIHAYCFDLLRRHVPKYETYDVLDDNRLAAFLTREAYDLNITSLDPRRRLFASLQTFRTNLDVIENELLAPSDLDEPFRGLYEAYLRTLDENRLLTYGQIIARSVEALGNPEVFNEVQGRLRHLIVDEYQDVNPAQEALVERLATEPVHLCIVGDDDQSIYQWRGSNVENILTFEKKYAPVAEFKIQQNRRSRPSIIGLANTLSAKIEGRLDKVMEEHREAHDGPELVIWQQATPVDEARVIAEAIHRYHHEHGFQWKEIAVLCRGRVSIPPLLEAFHALGIPAQSAGRTNLFSQPEADLLGRTICWLSGFKWRTGSYGFEEEDVTLDDLVNRYTTLYGLTAGQAAKVRRRLDDWGRRVADESKPASLVRELYDLLGELAVDEWDLADDMTVNRLGTLARCSQVLADYEAGRRRSRPDRTEPGAQRGANDRGPKYYKWLAIFVQNWARGAYEDFEGEDNFDADAVDVTTIHQAKGLEWPIVFVPAMSDRRFPSSRTGQKRDWRISTSLFDQERYQGTFNDERRLFYVAMTRARDFLSLSTFAALSKVQKPSRFLLEVTDLPIPTRERLPDPPPDETPGAADGVLEISFSELAQYRDCGLAYRLRTLVGFQPPLVPELGYGKAVHHVLRQVADHVQKHGRPTPKQLDRLFDDGFYLPAAGKAAHKQMKEQARRLVDRYLDDWGDDLDYVWAVERPFELHLGDAVVIGRADVIIDQSNGSERLAIVDYKTANSEGENHPFQLQVYTNAGRREGLTVDRAFVHDLRGGTRITIPVEDPDVAAAEEVVRDLVAELRARTYAAKPHADRCGRCDVSAMCKTRASD